MTLKFLFDNSNQILFYFCVILSCLSNIFEKFLVSAYKVYKYSKYFKYFKYFKYLNILNYINNPNNVFAKNKISESNVDKFLVSYLFNFIQLKRY
jgi:hypothetical protein